MNRVVLSGFLGLLMLSLTACGFQLRGSASVPEALKTLYIQGVNTRQDEFGIELKRALIRNDIRVVEDYEEGAALFTVLENRFERHVLSVGSDAKVREYEIETWVVYQISDENGELIGNKQRVEARRDYQFDRGQILAMDEQERVLRDDLNKQMVQSILRRLSAMK
jgi:LPS-assembly lipoprotein